MVRLFFHGGTFSSLILREGSLPDEPTARLRPLALLARAQEEQHPTYELDAAGARDRLANNVRRKGNDERRPDVELRRRRRRVGYLLLHDRRGDLRGSRVEW